jgi:two-component system, chemotaxis family, chemotaxis protein CheY
MIPEQTRFLIVDDTTAMRSIVRKQLRDLGFNTMVDAGDGKEGLAVLEEQKKKGEPVQMILSDWNMPVMDGLSFLKELRGRPEYKDMPFLMITAEGEVLSVKEAIVNGVSNYVVKPFSPSTFKEKLMAAWKKHHP